MEFWPQKPITEKNVQSYSERFMSSWRGGASSSQGDEPSSSRAHESGPSTSRSRGTTFDTLSDLMETISENLEY